MESISAVAVVKEVIGSATLYLGDVRDVLKELPDESVHCCVTSPPYWGLRDYGFKGQIGLEKTPEEYVRVIVSVFREVRRILRDDGTLWLNIGDCYATGAGKVGDHPGGGEQGKRWAGNHPGRANQNVGRGHPKRADGSGGHVYLGPMQQPNRMPQEGLKPKDLVGIPWRVAFALQADGWWLRQDIIWSKPSPMPESVTDRCTKSHEYIFLLSKSQRYYYDQESIKEPAAYGVPNSPESIKSPYGQGYTRRANKPVAGWATGATDHSAIAHARPKDAGRKEQGLRQSTKFGSVAGWRKDEKLRSSSRNKRSVWSVATEPCPEAHFATFPQKLIEPCILAGCPEGGVTLDPFSGYGTTSVVAHNLGRRSVAIEGKPEYYAMAKSRIQGVQMQQRLDFK